MNLLSGRDQWETNPTYIEFELREDLKYIYGISKC